MRGSLERVLNVYEKEQEEAERLLQRANARRHDMLKEIADIERRIKSVEDRPAAAAAGDVGIVNALLVALEARLRLMRERDDARRRLAEFERKELAEAQARRTEARRRVRAIELLIERRQRRAEHEEARRDNKLMDELGLRKWQRRKQR
jgi:flagellar export protein FliJ